MSSLINLKNAAIKICTDDLRAHIEEAHKPYCTLCSKVFKTSDDLQKHINGGHKFECDLCPNVYDSENELNSHMATLHSIKCTMCDAYFRSNVEASTHLAKQHSHNCNECSHISESLDELQKHFDKNHLDLYKCKYCEGKFNSHDAMNKHSKEVHNFPCQECNLTFPSKEAINNHMKDVHLSKYDCQLCDSSFENRSELNNHLTKEHKQKCHECKVLLLTSTELDSHLRNNHNFPCDICKEIFASDQKVRVHMEMEHCHYCTCCYEMFTSKDLLSRHYKEAHPNKCNFCEKILNSQEAINQHVEEEHTYDCNTCGFTGKGEEALEDHILEVHAVPDINGFYECSDCSFKSTVKTSFGIHFKTLHGSQSKASIRESTNKAELSNLKNNFHRLETLYHEALDETKKVKAEYEVKLLKANEDYTRVASQNEILNERNDILYKLGKSYIERTKETSEMKVTRVHFEKTNTEASNTDIIEIQDTIEEESMPKEQRWTQEKLRGFKRRQISTNRVEDTPTSLTASSNTGTQTLSENNVGSQRESDQNQNSSDTENRANTGSQRNIEDKLCYYFSNTGHCNFEERTGRRCKFIHDTSNRVSMCPLGINCSRPRCELSHPRIRQNWRGFTNENFLGNMRGQMQISNPWQVHSVHSSLNPWSQNLPNTNQRSERMLPLQQIQTRQN